MPDTPIGATIVCTFGTMVVLFASGVYLFRATFEDEVKTVKAVLVK